MKEKDQKFKADIIGPNTLGGRFPAMSAGPARPTQTRVGVPSLGGLMLPSEFGLVPVKIVKEDKAEYIQALVEARKQDSFERFREFMMDEHVRNLCKEIEEFKQSQHNDPISIAPDPINTFSDPIKQRLYQAVLRDGTLNYAGYAALIGVSEATIKRRLNELKKGRSECPYWQQ